MSTWVIVSWVLVALMTGINIFLFLKLKQASEQMLKMAFPGMDMGQAMAQMQKMMGPGGMGGRGFPGGAKGGQNAQLQAAIEKLRKK